MARERAARECVEIATSAQSPPVRSSEPTPFCSGRSILTTTLVVEGQCHAFEGFLYEDDPDETRSWEAFSARVISRARADDWLTVTDCHL